MPLIDKDAELIESHILREMSKEDHVQLEERLKDADFAKELELQKNLMMAINAEGRSHLKNELKGIENRIKGNSDEKPAGFYGTLSKCGSSHQ